MKLGTLCAAAVTLYMCVFARAGWCKGLGRRQPPCPPCLLSAPSCADGKVDAANIQAVVSTLIAEKFKSKVSAGPPAATL